LYINVVGVNGANGVQGAAGQSGQAARGIATPSSTDAGGADILGGSALIVTLAVATTQAGASFDTQFIIGDAPIPPLHVS
jgi:hypothetical protein